MWSVLFFLGLISFETAQSGYASGSGSGSGQGSGSGPGYGKNITSNTCTDTRG